jgi:hypothetical protein
LNTFEKLKRDYLRESFERDHLKRIIWEKKSFEREESEEEIFDKKRRNRILRQTTRKLKISINETLLFAHVWYLSFLNILFRLFLSNISFSLLSLSQMKTLSNDSSQMIFLKWFFQIISFKLFKRIQRNFSNDYYKDCYKSSSYTYI